MDIFTAVKIIIVYILMLFILYKLIIKERKSPNDAFLLGFIKSIKKVREALKIKDGYRLITNVGAQGGQEVPHLHFHLLSGEFSKRLVSD